jgi:hypothetical protein
MSAMNVNRLAVLAGVVCSLWVSPVAAQGSKFVPVSQLAVDVVNLKSGKSVRGAVVKAGVNGSLTMAVSREWLEHAHPDLYHTAVSHEADLQKQAAEQLRTRLKKQLQTPPNEPRLVVFLKQELERADELLARGKPVKPPQFLWVELEHDTIARVTRAPADRQRVAMWAWGERLSNVETRDAVDLNRELKQSKIDTTAAPPDLSDRLAPRLQDDREWAARMAVVEYVLAKPLDFQGTGDVLVRADAERKLVDLAPVLSKVLTSHVDSLLKDLTGEGRPPAAAPANDSGWLKSAATEAEAASINGLRATRVEVKVDGNQASVQTAFAARMPNGAWEVVWSHRETQDATKQRAEAEARIVADPQVKQVLDAVKSFGLGADDQVRQAIRFGAATMAAQQAADARFFEFRDRYLNHLDGPPLMWSK